MKDNNKLITNLSVFYKLEEFQVAYYKAQLSSSQSEYYRIAFSKMVDIESSHAMFFAEQLKEFGVEVPKVTGSLFTLAGSILGETIELTGTISTCKLGVTLESHAMNKYRTFIKETKNYPKLNNVLKDYLIDEEFHTLWMKDYLDRLTAKNELEPYI